METDPERMLEDLEGADLSKWEEDFIDQITELVESGRDLSDSQLDKLSQIHREKW